MAATFFVVFGIFGVGFFAAAFFLGDGIFLGALPPELFLAAIFMMGKDSPSESSSEAESSNFGAFFAAFGFFGAGFFAAAFFLGEHTFLGALPPELFLACVFMGKGSSSESSSSEAEAPNFFVDAFFAAGFFATSTDALFTCDFLGVGMEVRAGVVVPNSDVEMFAVGALNAEVLKEKPEVGAAMPVGGENSEDAAKGVDEGTPKTDVRLDVDGTGAVEEEEDLKEKPLEAAGAGAFSAEGAPKKDERFDVDGAGAAEEEEDPKEKPLEAAGAGVFATEDTEIEIEAVDPDV